MQHFFNIMNRKHLKEITLPSIQKKLFKKSVVAVEIEVFSFCNRKCWFCPNSYIDRFSENNYMNENLYLKILEELQSINYTNTISYSRYNEPLADKIILQRIQQARNILPKSFLHTNTNGDFLTKDYISELYNSGLNSLNIQMYLNKDENFNDSIISKKIAFIADKIQLPYKIVSSIPNEWYEIRFTYKDMSIRSYARNFKTNGCNRGGLVNIEENPRIRTSPCESVFNHTYIDYNGNVMPCCNLRSDSEKHKNFILGNVETSNIFKIYTNKKSALLRKNLYDVSLKIPPCDSCSFVEITPTKEEINKIKEIKIKNFFNF